MIGIVGAKGFIGHSVADYLYLRHISHQGFCKHPSETKQALSDKITPLDFTKPFSPDIFAGLDTLLFAASVTDPLTPNNTITLELEQNVRPSCEFFSNLRDTDIKHLIYLSSGGAIYGNSAKGGVLDENIPCHPCTPYGYGKLCLEGAIENIWTGEGRRYTIIRPSNPVGIHQMKSAGSHGLFTTVFHHIQTNQSIHVFGDGSTVRDYFSVQDLAALVLKADQQPNVGSTIVNASYGLGLSINEVIELCSETLGQSAHVIKHMDKQPKIQHNILSNMKAKELFGWTPKVAMQDIVDELMRFTKKEGPNTLV